MRLGSGEFDPPGFPSRTAAHGRQLFLTAISRNVPQVLEDLKQILPLYSQLTEELGLLPSSGVGELASVTAGRQCTIELAPDILESQRVLLLNAAKPPPGIDPVNWRKLGPLRDRIAALRGQYRLLDPWLLESIALTLVHWSSEGSADENFRYPLPLSLPDDAHPHLTFVFGPWEAGECTEARFKQLAEQSFRIQLDEYVSEVRKRYLGSGWRHTPEVRPRRADRHRSEQDREYGFDWLARYQCTPETQSSIARSAGVTESKVSARIRELAAVIGLTVRASMKRASRR